MKLDLQLFAKSSEDYWRDREEEALKYYIKNESEYDNQIKQIYQNMLDACQSEINAFYGRYAAKEGITISEAKKMVYSLDIEAYERKAKRYVKEKNFSQTANEEMRLYNATMKINRLELLKAQLGLELIAGHDELDKFMSGILQGRTEEELKRQAGILGKTIKSNSQKANAIPNASFHNATFSDRIWMYHDEMKADLSKLLRSGLIQGKNPRALAGELRKYVGDDTHGAVFYTERLMRTELARVQTEAQKQSFERNGFKMYTFLANSGCCGDCQALNGKHFNLKDMMPGLNAPPIHAFCRCSTAAYEDSKEYDDWLDFLSKGGTTAEWEKKNGKIGAAKSKEKIDENPKDGDQNKVNTETQEESALQDTEEMKAARKTYGKMDAMTYNIADGDTVSTEYERRVNVNGKWESVFGKAEEIKIPKNDSNKSVLVKQLPQGKIERLDWDSTKNTILSNGRVAVNYNAGNNNCRDIVKAMIDNEISILGGVREDGVFYRVTENKKDAEYIKSGKVRKSVNHFTGEKEDGLSVWEIPKYFGSYFEKLTGEVVGIGADGEPLLNVKTVKLVSANGVYEETVEKKKAGRELFKQKYNWTDDQIDSALTGDFTITR